MKYFKPEIWLAVQKPKARKWFSIWQRNLNNYWRQVRTLRTRLSKETFSLLKMTSLHDGCVCSIFLSDGLSSPLAMGRRNRTDPSRIEITAKSRDGEMYAYNYFGVRRFEVSYPGKKLFYTTEGGFGDWGYDEVTSAGKKYLRHEILFSSGATVLLEFRDLQLAKKKVKNAKH
jgi:hypothetical protein